jgi:hypothetical protein
VGAGQHGPREHNWVLDPLNSGDGSSMQVATFHHASIQLCVTVGCEHGAGPGVESRIILQRNDCGLNGIECAAAFAQYLPTSKRGFSATSASGLVALDIDRTRATMNDNRQPHTLNILHGSADLMRLRWRSGRHCIMRI